MHYRLLYDSVHVLRQQLATNVIVYKYVRVPEENQIYDLVVMLLKV